VIFRWSLRRHVPSVVCIQPFRRFQSFSAELLLFVMFHEARAFREEETLRSENLGEMPELFLHGEMGLCEARIKAERNRLGHKFGCTGGGKRNYGGMGVAKKSGGSAETVDRQDNRLTSKCKRREDQGPAQDKAGVSRARCFCPCSGQGCGSKLVAYLLSRADRTCGVVFSCEA